MLLLANMLTACEEAPSGSADRPESVAQESVHFEARISNGRVVGTDTLRVRQGQQVEIRWSTDVPLTIHLHGYDLELPVGPDGPRVQRFLAHATGRFPITVHETQTHSASEHVHSGHEHEDPHADSRSGEKTLMHLEVHPE